MTVRYSLQIALRMLRMMLLLPMRRESCAVRTIAISRPMITPRISAPIVTANVIFRPFRNHFQRSAAIKVWYSWNSRFRRPSGRLTTESGTIFSHWSIVIPFTGHPLFLFILLQKRGGAEPSLFLCTRLLIYCAAESALIYLSTMDCRVPSSSSSVRAPFTLSSSSVLPFLIAIA